MFPATKGRNGRCRPYQRQHLIGVLVTFRQQLAAEFASRNCSYTAVVAATESTFPSDELKHCPQDRGVHYVHTHQG